MPNSWFSYTGATPSLPSSYTEITTNAPGCVGTESLCAIYALATVTSKPVITSTLRTQINSALGHAPTSVALTKGIL